MTVCDFSLTSQAALWHRGVIVTGGWRPFCHGRVEKDKASPQPAPSGGALRPCLTCPAEDRDGHKSRTVHKRDAAAPVWRRAAVMFLNNGPRLARNIPRDAHWRRRILRRGFDSDRTASSEQRPIVSRPSAKTTPHRVNIKSSAPPLADSTG